MTTLDILAIVFGSIFAYGLGAGLTWGLLPEDVRWDHVWNEPTCSGVFSAFLWPVMLPAAIAKRLVD